MAKIRTMCHLCPWRRPNVKSKQPRFEQIKKDVAAGKYLVHACHLMSYDMIPLTERQECQGHKRHLIKLGFIDNNGNKIMSYKQLHGKTIKKIDNSSVNQLIFHFTDDTVAVIDTEAKGHGLYGPELIACGQKPEVEQKVGYSF